MTNKPLFHSVRYSVSEPHIPAVYKQISLLIINQIQKWH